MCAKHKPHYGKSKIRIPAEVKSDFRVLYIHPAKQGVDFHVDETMGRSYGLIPVGLPALVNVLKKDGIPVRGINYSIERQIDPTFDIKNWLKQFPAAQIVLIDLHWYEHTYGAIQAARQCKEVLPQAYTVLGGLSATGFSKQILEQIPEVDFIVRGDGEMPLLALAKKILQAEAAPSYTDIPNLSYRDGQSIRETECTYCASTSDLNELDFADISFMDQYRDYYVHE